MTPSVINRINLGTCLRQGAESTGDGVILSDHAANRSGNDLITRVAGVGSALRAMGVGTGDAVPVSIGEGVAALEAHWAVTQVGAVPVPISEINADAVVDIVARTGATVAIADEAGQPTFEGAGLTAGLLYGRKPVAADGWSSYEGVAATNSPFLQTDATDWDIAALAYRRDVDGALLGGRRTHRASLVSGALGSYLIGSTGMRVVAAVPLTCPVLEAVMFTGILSGSPVYFADHTNADALADAVMRHAAGSVMATLQATEALISRLGEIAPADGSYPLQWNVLVPPAQMADAQSAAKSWPSPGKNVEVRCVLTDPLYGFIARYDPALDAWNPLPTVDLATDGGRLAVRSPALSAGFDINADTERYFAGGWARTGVPGQMGKHGFTVGGGDIAVAVLPRDDIAPDLAVRRATAMDLGSVMRRGAHFHRDNLFVKWDGLERTYDETLRRTCRLSNGLKHAHGIGPGDRVALLTHNRPEFMEVYWAVAQLGAIVVPINFRLNVTELAYILDDSGASVLIAEPEFEPMFSELADAVDSPIAMIAMSEQGNSNAEYDALIARHDEEFTPPDLDDMAPAVMLYTAGTTGVPKGALRSHKSVLWFGFACTPHSLRIGKGGSYLAVPPMFHIAGHETSIFTCIMRGLKMVILSEFIPSRVLEVVDEEGISAMFVPPTMGAALIAEIRSGKYRLDSVREWSSASAPLPEPLRDEVLDRLPWISMRNSLGMTEVGGVAAAQGAPVVTKPATCVGRPCPTMEVRIEGQDGKRLPVGEAGEITLRSPQIIDAYWEKPEATSDALRGDWFHSGDIGCIDEDGYVHILGRLKDMIITGGENVYAAEVENALLAIPEIAEAAVVGMPDEKWGEAVTAFIVLNPGMSIESQQVIDSCRASIAHYKSPKQVFIRGVLPRNTMGKVLKHELA